MCGEWVVRPSLADIPGCVFVYKDEGGGLQQPGPHGRCHRSVPQLCPPPRATQSPARNNILYSQRAAQHTPTPYHPLFATGASLPACGTKATTLRK